MGTLNIRMPDSAEKRFKKYVLETEGSFRKQSAVAARALDYYLDAMGWPKEDGVDDK